MRVALVLNGEPPGPRELALLDRCDAVVCADGGAAAVLRAGRVPTLIVGDLDSLAPELAAEAERRGARVERLPAAKDETDGERALARGLALRPHALLLLGAHGRRTAMLLANLQLLRRAQLAGVASAMVGAREVVRFLPPGARLPLGHAPGATVSLLAHAGDAVVTLRGLAWSGDEVHLAEAGARGLSNRVEGPEAMVAVRKGAVFALVETEDVEPLLP